MKAGFKNKRDTVLLSTLAGVLVVFFSMQLRDAKRLKEENRLLKAQLEKTQNPMVQPAFSENPQSLSEAQSSELLRLRAEVAAVRRHQQEVAALPAKQEYEKSADHPPPTPPSQSFEAERALTLGALKQITQQFRALLRNKNLKAAIGPDGRLDPALIAEKFPEFDLNQVELLVTDPDQLTQVLNGTYGADVIVARTRTPVATPEGKWLRYYAIADGSAMGRITQNANQAFEGNWELREIPP